MDANDLNTPLFRRDERLPLLIEVLPEFAVAEPSPPPPLRPWLHVGLFLLTCASTFAARILSPYFFPGFGHAGFLDGVMYSFAVMFILLCHEMGHYLQALRYGVRARLPVFLPGLPPIGTFGAFIVMEPRGGDRKAVFDIGISGPLAGLVPTILFLTLGLYWSHYQAAGPGMVFGSPLLVKWIFAWMHGPVPPGHCISYHPFAFGGWVGLLITSINLMPIGQLDGGHILYCMIRKKANAASVLVLVAAIWFSIRFWLPGWWPMLGLITFLGARHPPTANDRAPLGAWRYVLGVATLAFIIVGFTPEPIRA